MGQLEKALKKNPVLVSWFLFAAKQGRVVHSRNSRNSDFGIGLYEIFVTSGYEVWRVPSYLVDGVSVFVVFGILSWWFQTKGQPFPIHGFLEAALAIAAMLTFRLVGFFVYTFLNALCNFASSYYPPYAFFYYFPGIPFRLLFAFDIIIPQALFMAVLYGHVIGWIVFAISMIQWVFRRIQGHDVYEFWIGTADTVALCILIGSVGLYYWF